MDSKDTTLGRLSMIWKAGDFFTFFGQFNKRSSYLVKKGTILFNEGEPLERVFFIEQGFVKLYRLSKDGRETTIYLYGPGQILGIRALTSEDVCARHYAEAITDLKVMSIKRTEYFEILSEHPEYLVDLLHVFIDRLNYTERKLEGFIITDVVSRIAYFLYDLAVRFCDTEKKQIALPLQLTHQRIAEFVGSTRETVTISMHKLEKDKILEDSRGKILILDLSGLKKLVQSSST